MIPKGKKKCPQCEDGWRMIHEEGAGMIREACYHCGNSGFITDEQAFMDRVSAIADKLAYVAVARLKDACNQNPDGEGWAFAAAENMLSEHDYTMGKTWEYQSRMMAVFTKMNKYERLLLEVLLDALDPPTEEEDRNEDGHYELLENPPLRKIAMAYNTEAQPAPTWEEMEADENALLGNPDSHGLESPQASKLPPKKDFDELTGGDEIPF